MKPNRNKEFTSVELDVVEANEYVEVSIINISNLEVII